MKKIDMAGKRFGHLTVMKEAYRINKRIYWLCLCDCGKEKAIDGRHLRDGNTTSCGCMQRCYGHGKTETRLYHIWCTMKARCLRETSNKYSRYGGRGITICDEWKNNFNAFYEWAKQNGYEDDLSIDRINNDKGYYPENCRWATPEEQANNTAQNVYVEYNGIKTTISRMARLHNMKPSILSKRLKRGWSIERAIETPSLGSTGR